MTDAADTPTPTHLASKFAQLREEPAPATLAERLAERRTRTAIEQTVASVLPLYRAAVRRGGCIHLAGCGGFHAGAMHFCAELQVRYRRDRAPIRAHALGCNAAVVTAAVNDLGPAYALAREFEALARPGDLLVVYSTSGESAMLRELALTAQRLGVPVLAWCPPESRLASLATAVASRSDQESVLACDHLIADHLEREIPGAA